MEKPKEILKLESEWGIQIDHNCYQFTQQNQILHLIIKQSIKDLSPIRELTYLRSFCCFDSEISDLEPLINLSKLEVLMIIGGNIENISPITNLENLFYLDLSKNKIKDISPITNLKNINQIHLSHNFIESIINFNIFPNLSNINLSFNCIKSITIEEINKINYKLKVNSEAFNKIKYINVDYLIYLIKIFDKNHDSYIDLANNPLQSPPTHIVQQGREAMLQWWERKGREGVKPLNEVRVLFLGWGNAGKTSVMRRVLGQEPTQGDEDSTHGINLVPWQVKTQSEQNVKVNLWDFGGQEIQHHTHQFFLAEDCIYVVVVNNRENDEPRYWLEYIRTMANAAPTILLFNKADQARNTQHNVAELMRDYPFIKHSFEIVAARPKSDLRAEKQVYYQENVAAFCTALRTQIETHPFVATEKYPTTTFIVKEWVEAETQLGKNHISKKAFRMACESRGVNEIEQNSWLDIFKKIGVITYIVQNLHLDKLLILNPEWMTFAVYRILLHPKTKALQGIISKNDLRELLYQDDTDQEAFRKKYRYEDEDFGSIIEIMKEYKLCYTHDTHTLMIPSAFPNNYNSPLEERTDGLNLKVSFKKFLPPSIVNTLIVELMSQQKIRKSWASGMEVVDKELQTEALVKFSNFEREIIIKVFGEHPRELLTLVRHEIKNIKRTFSDTLEMDELVPIPNKKAQWASYKTLLNLESKGKQYFQDLDGDDHSVKLLLENIETPQQTQHSLSQSFTHRHEFRFSFRFSQVQPQLEAIRKGLEELLPQLKTDLQWRTDLLEAIHELNEIRDSPTLPIHKNWSIRKIFDGMKDGKDVVDIITLAPDFAEKWIKLQALYDGIKHALDW